MPKQLKDITIDDCIEVRTLCTLTKMDHGLTNMDDRILLIGFSQSGKLITIPGWIKENSDVESIKKQLVATAHAAWEFDI